MGKVEYKLQIGHKELVDILHKYEQVVPPRQPLALDYDCTQLYYALEALRLFMEDQMLETNFEVTDEQD